MRRTSLRFIHVTSRPGRRAQGWLVAGRKTLRVALGRSGVRADKREGDGGTPAGRFHPIRLWWRADRLPPPRTLLPMRQIRPDDAWCEDPRSRRYNQAFRRSANEPGDRLRRDDGLYDLIIEIDHNTRPRVADGGLYRLDTKRLIAAVADDDAKDENYSSLLTSRPAFARRILPCRPAHG